MSSKKLHPVVEIEAVSASDILDALETLQPDRVVSGHGVLVQAKGAGPDAFLSWALLDIENAMQFKSEERKRHCMSALVNARRGFACLVDWYLQRDLATLCKNPPSSAKQKVNFLISRGVLDELTSRVVERAIGKRNVAEHEYQSPTQESAEDAVELFRRIISAVRAQSPPDHAPWLFGHFLFASGFAKKGFYAEFYGWSGPVVVFSRFRPEPWVGLVLPETDARAVIRRVFLRELTTDELLQLLALSGRKFGVPSSFSNTEICELLAKEACLLEV